MVSHDERLATRLAGPCICATSSRWPGRRRHDPASRFALAAQPLADRAAHRLCHRRQRCIVPRRRESPRCARELCRHHLQHRPDRRGAHRQHSAAALRHLPRRQRDQQHNLAELQRHRQPGRSRVDRAAIAGRQPSRLPGAGHQPRLLRALQVPRRPEPALCGRQALRRSVRHGHRRRCGARSRRSYRRPHRPVARPWHYLAG